MSKYRARKVKADGYTFDSQAEYYRWRELKLLRDAGLITDLRVHPAYIIQQRGKYHPPDGAPPETIRQRSYKADFSYTDENGFCIVEDVKGYRTAAFNVVWDRVRTLYPDLVWRIVEM